MKLIKKFNIDDWSLDVICSNCHSTLQIGTNDLIYRLDHEVKSTKEWGGYYAYGFYYKSICCNKYGHCLTDLIPKPIQLLLQQRCFNENNKTV